MNRESIYEVWKGSDHPWVKWVKPALFAAIEEEPPRAAREGDAYRAEAPPWAPLDTAWLPEGAAVIIDLEGEASVSLGLALGQRGARPVFAINTCSEFQELIDMRSVIELLSVGSRFRRSFPSGSAVTPAFILDSRRTGEGKKAPPGCFDNRWAIFDGDLPSAEDLLRAGIRRVVVVQRGSHPVDDLEAILRGYRAGGLQLSLRDTDEPDELRPVSIETRGWLGQLADGVLRRLRLRRRWDGSYGRRVPIPPEPSHG
jgi:hypothetical protein